MAATKCANGINSMCRLLAVKIEKKMRSTEILYHFIRRKKIVNTLAVWLPCTFHGDDDNVYMHFRPLFFEFIVYRNWFYAYFFLVRVLCRTQSVFAYVHSTHVSVCSVEWRFCYSHVCLPVCRRNRTCFPDTLPPVSCYRCLGALKIVETSIFEDPFFLAAIQIVFFFRSSINFWGLFSSISFGGRISLQVREK